jgi:WhiB family transcriptional regulator, redox-sensing transcriptional regulator
MFSARCLGQEELFFPQKGQAHYVKKAKALCDECIVRDDCADYADRHKAEYGVWAGRLHQPRD